MHRQTTVKSSARVQFCLSLFPKGIESRRRIRPEHRKDPTGSRLEEMMSIRHARHPSIPKHAAPDISTPPEEGRKKPVHQNAVNGLTARPVCCCSSTPSKNEPRIPSSTRQHRGRHGSDAQGSPGLVIVLVRIVDAHLRRGRSTLPVITIGAVLTTVAVIAIAVVLDVALTLAVT